MTTLITGGASQIGVALAKLLKASGRRVVFASRSGKVPDGFESVKFDWYDAACYENPFKSGESFDSVYLLPPPNDNNSAKVVIPFIDLAVEKGVKRFLLLTASGISKEMAEAVTLAASHKHLHDKGVDYFILRPSWFIGMSFLYSRSSIGEEVTS